jgi:hypothetical protein
MDTGNRKGEQAMSKKEWKESGTELGHAFKTFGKTFLRSVDTTADKISDFAEDAVSSDPNRDVVQPQPNSTVYSDGSWKKVGKELGSGFLGIGKTMLHTVGLETVSEGEKRANADHASQDPGNGQVPPQNGSGE